MNKANEFASRITDRKRKCQHKSLRVLYLTLNVLSVVDSSQRTSVWHVPHALNRKKPNVRYVDVESKIVDDFFVIFIFNIEILLSLLWIKEESILYD